VHIHISQMYIQSNATLVQAGIGPLRIIGLAGNHPFPNE
jgi:hypothetical protein